MILDAQGRPIMAADKPQLTDRGTLEGLADFKFFRNAVEYAVHCTHCDGIAAGVLHISDPNLISSVRTWKEKTALQNECLQVARRRHQCGVLHENKRDVGEWLEEISKR